MNKIKQQRLLAVAAVVVGLGAAAYVGSLAFRKNMMYFQTPSDLAQAPAGATIRLGGLVEKGSVQRGNGLEVRFKVADCLQAVNVRYEGILPDLFREGQGIVATGTVQNGQFVASEVLAKHDENYMPPDLAKTLKDQSGKHSCANFKPLDGDKDA